VQLCTVPFREASRNAWGGGRDAGTRANSTKELGLRPRTLYLTYPALRRVARTVEWRGPGSRLNGGRLATAYPSARAGPVAHLLLVGHPRQSGPRDWATLRIQSDGAHVQPNA
jgi:hypothetical protein